MYFKYHAWFKYVRKNIESETSLNACWIRRLFLNIGWMGQQTRPSVVQVLHPSPRPFQSPPTAPSSLHQEILAASIPSGRFTFNVPELKMRISFSLSLSLPPCLHIFLPLFPSSSPSRAPENPLAPPDWRASGSRTLTAMCCLPITHPAGLTRPPRLLD